MKQQFNCIFNNYIYSYRNIFICLILINYNLDTNDKNKIIQMFLLIQNIIDYCNNKYNIFIHHFNILFCNYNTYVLNNNNYLKFWYLNNIPNYICNLRINYSNIFQLHLLFYIFNTGGQCNNHNFIMCYFHTIYINTI